MDLPVQDDADVKERILLDLEVRRKSVLVPAENNAGGDGLNIHGGRLDDAAVVRGVFDDFFMEHLVLAPAGDRVKLAKMVRVGRDVEIALHELGVVAVLRAQFKIFADHELKKLDRVA